MAIWASVQEAVHQASPAARPPARVRARSCRRGCRTRVASQYCDPRPSAEVSCMHRCPWVPALPWEHSPDAWRLCSCCGVTHQPGSRPCSLFLGQAMEQAGAQFPQLSVRAVGITNQREWPQPMCFCGRPRALRMPRCWWDAGWHPPVVPLAAPVLAPVAMPSPSLWPPLRPLNAAPLLLHLPHQPHCPRACPTPAGETTLVWDRVTGKPLHNAIVWLDNRTSSICQAMAQQLGSQDHFRPGGLPGAEHRPAHATGTPPGPPGQCTACSRQPAHPRCHVVTLSPQRNPPVAGRTPGCLLLQSPGCPSRPTFLPTSSSGCWTTCQRWRQRRRTGAPCLAPSTPGSSTS